MKLTTLKTGLVALTAGMVLSGCATIMNGGSTQSVNVTAVDAATNRPIPGAACSVTDGQNVTSYVNGNPGVAVVTRGHGSLTVSCHKAGYLQTRVASGNSLDAWVLGNVLFWPGAIVDAATGAAVKYPSNITVVMTRK